MGITIPGWLQWVSYLAGSEWPQGDETAMFRIGEDWHASAGDLKDLVPDLDRVHSETMSVLLGETANAFDDQFAKLFGGDYSVDKLATAMSALGDLAKNCGTQIEYTKIQILSTLAIAAAEIGFALAASPETFGASLALIPGIEALTMAAVRTFVTQLLSSIAEQVAQASLQTVLKALAIHILADGLGQEIAIQAYQVGAGHRGGFDAKQIGQVELAALTGRAVGAPVNRGVSRALGPASNPVSGAVKGAVSGYAGGVAGNAAGIAAVGGEFNAAGLFGSGVPGGVSGGVRGARAPHTGSPQDVAAVHTPVAPEGIHPPSTSPSTHPDAPATHPESTALHGATESPTQPHQEPSNATPTPPHPPDTTTPPANPTATTHQEPATSTPTSSPVSQSFSGSDGGSSPIPLHADTSQAQHPTTAPAGDPTPAGSTHPDAAAPNPVGNATTHPPLDAAATTPSAAPVTASAGPAPSGASSAASSPSHASTSEHAPAAPSTRSSVSEPRAVASATHPAGIPVARSADSVAGQGPSAREAAAAPRSAIDGRPSAGDVARPVPHILSPAMPEVAAGQPHPAGSSTRPAAPDLPRSAEHVGAHPDSGRDTPPRPAAGASGSGHDDGPPSRPPGGGDGPHPNDGGPRDPGDRGRDVPSHPDSDRAENRANEALWKRIPPVQASEVRHHLADRMFGEQRATDNATWWRGLSGEEQRALIDTYPSEIGNAEGIPAWARTEASEHALSRLAHELQSRQDAGEHLTRPEKKELKRYNEIRRALDEANARATELGGEVHILAFDPHAFSGEGRMVVSIGHDPYHSDSVSWHIPGLTTTIDSLGGNLTNAIHHLESVRMEHPDLRASSIAWIGYDAPSGRGSWRVASHGLARDGGHILHGDITAFNAARDVIAADGNHFSNNHLFGHSYGSTTTSYAGQHGRLGEAVRTVTLLGSPGAGPQRHASDFSVGDNVFVASSSRDPVTALGGRTPGSAFRLRPLDFASRAFDAFSKYQFANLGGNPNGHFFGIGLGVDPAMHGFGAHRITAEFPASMDRLGSVGTHTSYYDYVSPGVRSESLANFGRIAAGRSDLVHTEPSRTNQPLWHPGTAEPAQGRPLHLDGDSGGDHSVARRAWDPHWQSGHDESSSRDGRCAHDANDILTSLTGREARLATDPALTGTRARALFEARNSAARFADYEQVHRELLRGGDGTTAVLASKWSGAGQVGGHAYVARNDNGIVHLYERVGDRIVSSGWPPHWGGHTVEETAVGYFDRHGNALEPLTDRHGELHAADKIGDVAGNRRLESDGPAHPARIIDKVSGHSEPVPRSEHVTEYPPGTHPEFPGHAVTEIVRTVGHSEARFIQIDGKTARVEGTLRDVFDNVDRPNTENRLTRALSRTGFHGGHIVGFRFLLDQGEINLFRQTDHFNNPVYRTMENEWSAFVTRGAEVEFTINLIPPGIDPHSVTVKYNVFDQHGTAVHFRFEKFENNEQQSFRRLPTRDIEHRLDLARQLHEGTLAPLADPARAGHPHDVGENWFRGTDHPESIDAHYGEPRHAHWSYPHDPTDPSRINPDVATLVQDAEAPYGRGPDGNAYTQAEYEARFNTRTDDGEQWMSFPGNDGAVVGSRVLFNDLEKFIAHYGQYLDRIGEDRGKYLGVMADDRRAGWEQRGMHVNSLKDPYSTFTLRDLPAGWKIEVSEIAPGCGQPGGALQVRIINDKGVAVPVNELTGKDGAGVLSKGGPN